MPTPLQQATFFFERKRYAQAATAAKAVLTDEPHNSAAIELLILALINQKERRQALHLAQNAIAVDPDNFILFRALALAWSANDDPAKAEATIRRALRLAPYHADLYALLGEYLLDQQQWTAALKASEQGIKLDPTAVDCFNVRAVALNRLGKPNESLQTLLVALQEEPENPQTHTIRGWIALEHGERLEALAHFRQALQLEPELAAAKHGLTAAIAAQNPLKRLLLNFLFQVRRTDSVWGILALGLVVGLFILLFLMIQLTLFHNRRFYPVIAALALFMTFYEMRVQLSQRCVDFILLLTKTGRTTILPTAQWRLLGAACLLVTGVVLTGVGFLVHHPPVTLGGVLALILLKPFILATDAISPNRRMWVVMLLIVGSGALALALWSTDNEIATLLALLCVAIVFLGAKPARVG